MRRTERQHRMSAWPVAETAQNGMDVLDGPPRVGRTVGGFTGRRVPIALWSAAPATTKGRLLRVHIFHRDRAVTAGLA